MEITLNVSFLIQLVASGLAVWDAITRLRGNRGNSILAIAELILGGLLLLSLFIALPGFIVAIPIALLLLIDLLLLIFLRGGRARNSRTITIIAAVLTAIIVLVRAGWLNIPGL